MLYKLLMVGLWIIVSGETLAQWHLLYRRGCLKIQARTRKRVNFPAFHEVHSLARRACIIASGTINLKQVPFGASRRLTSTTNRRLAPCRSGARTKSDKSKTSKQRLTPVKEAMNVK